MEFRHLAVAILKGIELWIDMSIQSLSRECCRSKMETVFEAKTHLNACCRGGARNLGGLTLLVLQANGKAIFACNCQLLQSGIYLDAIPPVVYAVAHGFDGKMVFLKNGHLFRPEVLRGL